RAAGPRRRRPGRPARGLGQGSTHRPGSPGRAHGAAAGEVAAHHRARLPARGRPGRPGRRPEPAGPRHRPGGDLRAVRGVRGRRPARRGRAAGPGGRGRGGHRGRGGGLMRLHALELTAIGPYAAPQRIDFDRLTSGGLFLLEGPTGGGKTTILDAITFALYWGLSGEGADRGRLHSDFADPAAEPSVTLEFSVRGERYLIHRVPDYQRPKKRGDGFTQQATRVHLQRFEGGRWVSQSSSKAEVGELITDAIGLSRAQFTQVMLLPQGEFARFLRSDDDDRRTLLTKLFGTELYDRITAEAAAEAAGLDAAERAELLGLGRADRATRLKQRRADLAAAIEVNDEAREVAAERLSAARAAAERETRQAELTGRLVAALDELAAHEAGRGEHDGRVDALAAARRAEPVRPLLAGLEEARAAVAASRAELCGLGAEDAEPADAADRAERAAAEADQAERVAAELEHLVRQEEAQPGLEAELAALRDTEAAAAGRVGRLELARQQLPERIDA